MKERGIILKDWEVRGILDGRITQLRRVIKPQPDWIDEVKSTRISQPSCFAWPIGGIGQQCGAPISIPPCNQPGARRWVKEAWAQGWTYCGEAPCTFYRATGDGLVGGPNYPRSFDPRLGASLPNQIKWKPSIHMPRWASRITLENTGVRVEMVQDISGPDCWASGIESAGWDSERYGSVTECYRDIWNSIYGNRPKLPGNPNSRRYARVKKWLDTHPDTSWEANPWVWVIDVEMIKNN